jgi:hypothetical protein
MPKRMVDKIIAERLGLMRLGLIGVEPDWLVQCSASNRDADD